MTGMLVKETLRLTLEPGQRIVRREEYADWLEAGEIREAAGRQARRLRHRIGREYRRSREAARMRGQREAEADAAARMSAYSETAIQHLRGLESDVERLVSDAVATLVGERPPEERLRAVVGRLLEDMAEGERTVLAVHPDHRDAVAGILGPDSAVRVRTDTELGRHQIRVEGPLGIAECDLDGWIATLGGTAGASAR